MGQRYIDLYDIKDRCWNCRHAEQTEVKDIIKCDVSKTHWNNRNVCSRWEKENKDEKEKSDDR